MAKQDMRQKLVYIAYRKLRGHPINLNIPGNFDSVPGQSYCVGYGRVNDALLFKVEKRYGGWQHTKEEMNQTYYMENSILEPQFLYWNVYFRMPVIKELLKQIKYKDET